MIRKIMMLAAAAAAFAAAAAVCVVALAFAIYALAEPWTGPAGAGAVVAGLAALSLGAGGLALKGGAVGRARRKDEPAGLVENLMGMARKRPVVAAGVAVAAGIYALRNPTLLAALMGAMMENRSRKG